MFDEVLLNPINNRNTAAEDRAVAKSVSRPILIWQINVTTGISKLQQESRN
jgi:hypothetical protein